MCRGHWSRGSSSEQAGSSEEGSGGEKSVARLCLWWADGGGHLRSSVQCRNVVMLMGCFELQSLCLDHVLIEF